MSDETIKANIVASFIKRHHSYDVDVTTSQINSGWTARVIVNRDTYDVFDNRVFRRETQCEALSSLAIAVGLSPDGTDPIVALHRRIEKLALTYERGELEQRDLAARTASPVDALVYRRGADWQAEVAADLRDLLLGTNDEL